MSIAYAQAALNSECAKLARTTSGRNQQLNASAFSVGQLVGAGTLDRTLAEQRLFDAATTNGYVGKDGAAATRSTIKSGLDRGERSPRNIQLRDKAPDLVQATRRRVNDVITSSCLDDAERVTRARYLWAQRQALDERYLCGSRGLNGPFPATLGYLPARGEHAPAMIGAFGPATEPEPGVLAIADHHVTAVHLTKLTPDGGQKSRHSAQQDHGR